MKEKIKIPGFGNETIEFSDSFVEYAGRRIYYKDVVGLSYHSVKESINFVPTNQSYYVAIQGNNDRIDINFNSSFFIKNKENLTLFSQLVYIAEEVIKPFLFFNLLNQLKNKKSIEIGFLNITTDGLYIQRFLRKPEFLPWCDYGFCKIEEGLVHVYKKHPQKKERYKFLSSIALKQINAVILPEILEYLKREKIKRGGKETEETVINLCLNCRSKLKKAVNFCPQCGEKIKG